jgi:trigger factor
LEPYLKITQDEAVDRQITLHIELEDEDLAPYLDRSYRKLAQQLAIPGFRKGKAPRTVVESFVGRESLIHEALDDMLPVMTQRAIDEQEIESAGTPAVELIELDPVTVKATVPLIPEVDLGAYKDIRLEDTPTEITSEDVDGKLGELQDQASSWEPVEREVAAGDMTTMDVKGHVDEEYILNNEDAVYVVDLESTLPFAGFSEQLVGMEVGTEKEFTLKVPADHSDNRFAGQDIHMSVTVKDVKERLRPELDDEFAKSVGDGHDTFVELRESTETELNTQAEEAQTAQYRESALDALVSGGTFKVAPLLIDHEVEHMVDRRDRFVERLEVSMDDYLRYTGKTDEEMKDEMREHAMERFTRSYALSNLAEAENIVIPDEEIDERIKELEAAREGQENTPDDQSEVDLNSEATRTSIKESLLVSKSLDRLVSIAKGDETTEASKTDDVEPEEGGDTDHAES